MEKDEKIFVAAHQNMVGSALYCCLQKNGFSNLIVKPPQMLDLLDQRTVMDFFLEERPDYVFLPSVQMGGIIANRTYPAEFIYNNLQAQTNVIHSSWKTGVKKLIFLGSSCSYPKECPQPMKEEYLLSGKVEPTSEPYAVAKIAGMVMCRSYNRQYGTKFITAIPADLYGPEDDFDPETSHVLPSLVRKMYEAKISNASTVMVWGTGSPRREFLHVDDLADSCLFLIDNYDGSEIVNIGFGEDISIGELASIIKEIVGFNGEIVMDRSKPDGSPRKLLDSEKMSTMGWKPSIELRRGIQDTFEWYKTHFAS
ncbi:MAG: GDP-L-fucose synthase [Chloroflexi bacterium]|nr:GDP-L-fucose synthase [Chloroflexota bacterium]